MKSGHRYILYIVVSLIILSGLALFFLRNQLVVFLSDQAGVKKLDASTKIASSSIKNALDTEIFKAPKFIALKNNVVNFNFDLICKTAVGEIETIATTTEGEVATSTKTLNCVLGNDVPFPLPLKTK